MNKKYLLIIAFIFAIIAKVDAQVCFGDAVKFNEGWRFELQDDYAAKNMSFKDDKWREVLLPHDWSVEFPMAATNASCQGYLPGGIGWYRKHFTLTNDMPYQYIYFEGVYNRSEVYLNGHLLGKRPNGFISFMYDMTPYLSPDGENVLAVRVDHSRAADSRWYTGSGIYRDVWLVSAPEVHIAQWGVTYRAEKFTGNSVEVAVDVEIDNKKGLNDKLDIEASLVDKSGKVVATAKSKAQTGVKGISMNNLKFKVANVNRWSLENPYLYTLKVNLKRNGKVVDNTTVSAGLRELAFDANTGFALNGKEVGEMKPYDEETGVIYWDIPYKAGELKVEGCDKAGKVESNYSIKSSSRPYSLRATVDKTTLSTDRAVAHIVVELLDENGVLVKLADNEVTCKVEGAARLLGLDSGSNTNTENYRDNKHRIYQGRLLTYIETTGKEGDIKVTYSSPLLKGCEVILKAE